MSFEGGPYDRAAPLVIDPVLVYSTFLSGSMSGDLATAIAVDAEGSVYVTGRAVSPDFPATTGASAGAGSHAFVTRLDPTGSAIVYSTLLGPMALGAGIAVDAAGHTYVTGQAQSADMRMRRFHSMCSGPLSLLPGVGS